MSADDLLGFVSRNAGKGYRSSLDDEPASDEGENLQGEEVIRPPKHRAKQKSFKVVPGNPQLGTEPHADVTLINRKRTSLPCFNANRDQGHSKATHIFHTPNTSAEGGVGYPLCPTCLSKEQEHLATWRKSNPDTHVKQPEPITPDVLNRHVTEERGMEADKRSFIYSGLMSPREGSMPLDMAHLFTKTPYAGPGRSPGSTKNTERTPEFKEAALDAALKRARAGTGGRTPAELKKIGEEQEAKRDYSTGYVKTDDGRLTRYYKTIGEEAKGKRKPIAKGNYVKQKDAAPGESPIEKVMNVAKTAKAHGTYLDKDIWGAIIENHGEGVIQPKHVIEHVRGKQIEKEWKAKNKDKKQQPLPIPRRAGAYSAYIQNAGTEISTQEEKNGEGELWGYLSRNGEFESGSSH